MKKKELDKILDLIEEIRKVDKMIAIHENSSSDLMSNQYKSQKLKLSNFLFEELFTNSENRSEIMYITKLVIEKLYHNEMQRFKFDKDDELKRIEESFENYS